MDKRTFQTAMRYLSAAYDRELGPETVQVYWTHLRALADAPFQATVRLVVATDATFPRLSRLLEVYGHEARRAALDAAPRRTPPSERDPAVAREALARIRQLLRSKGVPMADVD